MTAISVKERVLACLSVFIKKNNPGTFGRGVTIDKQSGYQERIEIIGDWFPIGIEFNTVYNFSAIRFLFDDTGV